jgi:hypothetical protein
MQRLNLSANLGEKEVRRRRSLSAEGFKGTASLFLERIVERIRLKPKASLARILDVAGGYEKNTSCV